jgi:esterase/lipase superfamily enzyme
MPQPEPSYNHTALPKGYATMKHLCYSASLIALFLLQGCHKSEHSAEYSAPASVPQDEEPTYGVVRVFYVTDRNTMSSAQPADTYGSKQGPLSYGTCDVSIPRDHRMGELEAPTIWKLEFRKDPEKHVVLLDVTPKQKTPYFSELVSRIQASPRKNAFLFVHGYNVTFEDAARRTAQMAYDLGFEGAPVFYSWPSQGTLLGYGADEISVEATKTNLTQFLTDFVGRTDATNIYLIAHSMGNRALTSAFASVVTKTPALRQRFREVILTAPDIDAEVFKRDIAPQLLGQPSTVTLYASSVDTALIASKKYHGGRARAGDCGAGLVVLPNMETVDASAVDTGFLGHSYYAEQRSLLGDMYYLIRDGLRASQRFSVVPVGAPPDRYWKFKD